MTKTKSNRGSGGAQILDYSEAEQLLRQGLTQAEVAQRFGVTQPAISAAIRRGRIKFDTGAPPKRLPWTIKKEHTNLAIPRLLRFALRIEDGDETLRPEFRKQGEAFVRRLREMDAVIHYEADVEPHFFRVPRRHGIDTGLWREPEE